MTLRHNRWGNVWWKTAIAGLAVLGMMPKAYSQWIDGEDLFHVCEDGKGPHVFQPGVCAGYLMAVVDLAEGLKEQGVLKAPLFCMPLNVTMPQVQHVVEVYIAGHPARKNVTGTTLAVEALQAMYPCK
jgi:hypothetical protein